MPRDRNAQLTIPTSLERLDALITATTASPSSERTAETIAPDVAYVRDFCSAVVSALYADRDTGAITGQNTICERSCADFVEAISSILDQYGLAPNHPDRSFD